MLDLRLEKNLKSQIYSGSIKEAIGYVKEKYKSFAIIVDLNVYRIYNSFFTDNYPIVVRTAEKYKTMDTVEKVYNELLARQVDRNSFILCIGGGILTDLGGFVASTYMRGLKFGYVSTTLLSIADAGIGGKNGINFNGLKNIIGTFNQPEFIFLDIHSIKTLKRKDYIAGFSEIIKHSLISSKDIFNYLAIDSEGPFSESDEFIEKLISFSVKTKAEIVCRDEFESGERKLLNFGHTIGHALEKIDTNLIHGEAISIGMAFASYLSYRMENIGSQDFLSIIRLLRKFFLPVKYKHSIDLEILTDVLKSDKKINSGVIDFTVLREIGSAKISKFEIPKIIEIYANFNEVINGLH
ncbi:MAG: 3-dehydroquinate synthase [Candidatus Delongbacteria bacterium]|nr:3-dehydroquinate synthase [Candidatus Delongbacteria bacterium]MBN2833514.1 3-dehydroquinate synthase [Candidatus Delongbacteria bacterium]